jgi:hypothetical protein
MSPRAKKTTSTVIPKPKLVRNQRCDSYDSTYSLCSLSSLSSLEYIEEYLEMCIEHSHDENRLQKIDSKR